MAAQHAQRLSVAYNNLAGILKLTGRLGECIQCYEHVVYLQVGRKAVWSRAANSCCVVSAQGGRVPIVTEICMQRHPRPCPPASRLLPQPQSPEAYANLASAFKDSGRHDEAINTYRQVSRHQPIFLEF